MVCYLQPTQQQLDNFQENLVMYPPGPLEDEQLYSAFTKQTDTVIMTVSRLASQRINRIVCEKLFPEKEPLSRVPSTNVFGQDLILPYKGMRVAITENRDKAARIVNGQHAKIVNSHVTVSRCRKSVCPSSQPSYRRTGRCHELPVRSSLFHDHLQVPRSKYKTSPDMAGLSCGSTWYRIRRSFWSSSKIRVVNYASNAGPATNSSKRMKSFSDKFLPFFTLFSAKTHTNELYKT